MLTIGFDAKRYYLNRTGLGNYSRDLIRMLREYYPENTYLTYTPKTQGTIFAGPELKMPHGMLNNLFPSIWRSYRITKDLTADKVDIFHGLSGEIPHGLRKNRIRSIVTIHDLIFLRYPELYKPLDRYIYNRKSKYAVENADKIVAISEQTKQDITHFYGIPQEKIDVIYQSCHAAFKQKKTAHEKEAIRKKHSLPESFVLNVGSIEPRKNALQIVKAIEHIDTPLLLIGKETPYTAQIRKYIMEKGMTNKVLIKQGFTTEELSTIYQMANIFIYPSKFEGFGIPIIEALYSETPVITTNSGVFPEAGGPFSYYIDPNNTEELAYAISTILSNHTMRTEMKQKGLEYVQRFNDDVLVKQWMNMYKQLT